jgi:ankyrin repeat protein
MSKQFSKRYAILFLNAIKRGDVAFLRKNALLLDGHTEDGSTPLMLACVLDCEKVVEVLCNLCLDINAIDNRGFSALHFAVKRDQSGAVVSTLLRHGANPNLVPNDGRTSIEFALRVRPYPINITIMQLLVDYGAIVDGHYTKAYLRTCLSDGHMWTPSTEAQVSFLIKHGVNLNKRADGWSPLAGAIDYDLVDIVKLMLQFGADALDVDKEHHSAIEYAKGRGRSRCVKLMQVHQALQVHRGECVACDGCMNKVANSVRRTCRRCLCSRYCSAECENGDLDRHRRLFCVD